MNRLVPSRPPLARVRRHVGALPHGLPTALLFTAAVAALMLGSFVVVDRALPVLARRDADQVSGGSDASVAVPAPDFQWAMMPAVTAAGSPSASPRPDPTTDSQTGASTRTEVAADRRSTGQQSSGGSNARTVSFRRSAESPSPTAGLGDGRRATPEPSPTPPWSLREDEGRDAAPTPTATPAPAVRQASTPLTTPRPSSWPSPTPSPRPTDAPASPTPEPDD